MRLIEQTCLFFQEGKSDKVYEVDLVEVTPGSFVVNFRYGRRGADLRDGSKTPNPVTEAKARKIYAELIGSKTKKGYQQSTGKNSAPTPASSPIVATATDGKDPRIDAIIKRIQEGDDSDSDWLLSRAVWRAGEFKIAGIVDVLTGLMGQSPMQDYTILAALGKSGPDAVPFLKTRFRGSATNLNDRQERMTTLALLEASNRDTAVIDALENMLPSAIRSCLGNAEALQLVMNDSLRESDPGSYRLVTTLYLIGTESCRQVVKAWLLDVAFRPPFFRVVRHLFKASGYLGDGEFYGLIARRFEKTSATYSSPTYRWGNSFYANIPGKGYQRVKYDDLKTDQSPVAYGSATRAYLRRHVQRQLNRTGSAGSEDYVRLAVGVLLAYSDDDAGRIYQTVRYIWERRRYSTKTVHWDKFSALLAFNQILYANSPRYQQDDPKAGWHCIDPYKPGDPAPDVREEAYPALWDAQPMGLLHLIGESRCEVVHQFAVRALRDNMNFVQALEEDVLIMMLGSQYDVSASFGFEQISKRLSDGTLNLSNPLLLGLACSRISEARLLFTHRVGQNPQLLNDTDLVLKILQQAHVEIIRSLETLLPRAVSSDNARDILDQAIDWLHHVSSADEGEKERLVLVGKALILGMRDHIKQLPIDRILELVGHGLPVIQEIGADLLVAMELPANQVPSAVIQKLLRSAHEPIRSLGMRIISNFSDIDLKDRRELLVSLLCSKEEDLRTAVRPVLSRLCRNDSLFAQDMADELLAILKRARLGDEILGNISRFCMEQLSGCYDNLPADEIWNLLQVQSKASQELGGALLPQIDASALTIRQIVNLGYHAVLTV